jgi:hypothetical protein
MEVRYVVISWNHLAEDKIQWQNLENTVMDLLIPLKERNFLIS